MNMPINEHCCELCLVNQALDQKAEVDVENKSGLTEPD